MPAVRARFIANVLAALSGVVVIVLHIYAGVLSMGHPVLRPIGEPTMLLFVGWIVSVALCTPVLVLTRGRSRAAIVALAITVLSALLVLVGRG